MLKSYAAYNTEEDIRKKSSSGGIFSLLANEIIERSGAVYGVSMSDDCYSAEFIRVTSKDALARLRSSKYFQAKVGRTFLNVKQDLETGMQVLFSGTGCQINGLKCFLGKEYDNLICVDVVCHGVPSPDLWKRYALYQEAKYGKLTFVNFRCKDDGWKNFGLKENALLIPKSKDAFLQMFLSNYCLRPSCYECRAKQMKLADLSIADLWGIEQLAPDFDDGHGCSWVIARSLKGEELLKSIESKMVIKEIPYEKVLVFNSPESKSVGRPVERENFFTNLNTKSFDWMIKKYGKDSLIVRAKRKVKKIVKKLCVRGGGKK